MTQSSLTVIKVGGSLFDWPELPRRMGALLAGWQTADRGERMILVAGGGAAADIVRELDTIHKLGDRAAHRLALHAMDLTANIMAQLIPGTVAVDSLDHARTAWSAGSIPVLIARAVLDQIERTGSERLPESWDVTSDSIAARLAVYLEADRLILIKSAPLPAGTTCDQAARLGLVDPMLPVVARTLPRVEYLCLREPAIRPQLLT